MNVPAWASASGHRWVLPVGLLAASEKHLFEYGERVYPIYFETPSEKADDITLELPSGWQVASLPAAANQDLRVVAYASSAENNKGILHLTRKLDVNIIFLEKQYYGPLRNFFQMVKSGDDEQVVLQQGTAVSSN